MKSKNIKFSHPNKKIFNWLIYKCQNKIIRKYSKYFKGIVYDFGCGERPYEKYILESAKEYIGIDWGSTFHKLKADIVADLNKPIPVENNIADVVVSFSVLEHLKEPQMMLNEASRILKKGGMIFLFVPWQWWIHEQPYDFFRYTPFGLKFLLKRAGFNEITIEPTSGFFTMWVLKFNYFTLRVFPSLKKRFVQLLLGPILIPIWTLGQLIAPILDKLDRNWLLESASYACIAKKL